VNSMSSTVRAFLSIDIEDKTLLSHISQIQKRLDLQSAKMKIVEIDNIHFTLRFFGDTPLAKLDQIQNCLQQIEVTPFEIRIIGVGSFPNRRRPRVIWVGVTDNSQRIVRLKNEIDEKLSEVGYRPENEKFTPHATIARVRSVINPSQLVHNLEELSEELVGNMIVSSINMKRSTLTSSGAVYETLWTIE
jgi:2'-5' RNA ligase